jgi:hypothetical protein
MTENLIYLLSAFGAGSVLAAGVAFLLVKNFLPAYLGEKAKNLATREDVSEITSQVERVRTQYASLVEELKARHQLRVAALDRRLQAHQEAFTLWRGLLGTVHSEKVGNEVIKCQSWWEQNCVYLEPTVREAFVDAYSAAHSHEAILRGRDNRELAESNWKRISAFPNILFAAVQLPGLSELEKREIESLSNARFNS